MKHLFALLFVLFFGFNAQATTCPADKPLQDIKGNCYSCDDERTFVSVPYEGEIAVGPNEIQYQRGNCTKFCPNRLVYTDGWLDASHYCVLDTLKNRLVALWISNMISMLIIPLNWINFFLLVIVISQILIWIFKKYESKKLTNIIRVFSIFLSFPLTLVFINNPIITLIGTVFIIIVKMKTPPQNQIEKKSEPLKKSCFNFIKIVCLILILLFIVTGLLIFLGNNL